MNSVLVTGATGFFGQAFVRFLLKETAAQRIVIYSRDEVKQYQMAEALKPAESRLRFMIGDVRDKDRLRRALRDVDTVIHAAALKRIDTGHYNPDEVIKTNILGTENVIDAAMDDGVEKCILLSSDKAYQPVSPYGRSKAMAEDAFINANNMRGWRGPKFAVCRYGNVWNSTGSVVPRWREIIKAGSKQINVTDPDCTRFYMTIDEAIGLVIHAYDTMRGGEIYIPGRDHIRALSAFRLGDLANAFGVPMKVTGLPSWEKKHESLSEGNSSDIARRLLVPELVEALRQ